MTHLETIWHGGMRHVYLTVPDPEQPILRVRPVEIPPTKPYESRQGLRLALFALLEEQPRWTVKALKAQLGAGIEIHGVIDRAVRAREVARECHGTIRLIRKRGPNRNAWGSR